MPAAGFANGGSLRTLREAAEASTDFSLLYQSFKHEVRPCGLCFYSRDFSRRVLLQEVQCIQKLAKLATCLCSSLLEYEKSITCGLYLLSVYYIFKSI